MAGFDRDLGQHVRGGIQLIVVNLTTRRPNSKELEGFLEFHRSGDTTTTVVSDD